MKYWYLVQQSKWTLRHYALNLEDIMKETRRKRSHIVWFHLYEISRIGKSMEIEHRLWLKGAGGGKEWEVERLIGIGFPFVVHENILQLDRGGGCIT